MVIDSTDKRILRALQQNGGISNLELAEQVGLSPSPCARRVKALQDAGVIEKTTAHLNAKKLGLDLQAVVFVTLKNHMPDTLSEFEFNMSATDAVLECLLLTGNTADYMLRVMVKDMYGFQDFILKSLTVIESVRDVHSSFVMREVVKARGLPVS